MSEADPDGADAFAALQARADALEQQLRDAEASTARRVREAELKAEAARASIVDLDGLRLLDTATVADTATGAAEAIAKLRAEKPWLFGAATTSSAAAVPPATPPRRRQASEMSVEEWRVARAELLRRR